MEKKQKQHMHECQKHEGQKLAMKRLFIANRGEILRRIASTARVCSIEVVAIKEAGQPAPRFLKGLVDRWHDWPGRLDTSVYLDQQAMIGAAKEHGCDAIHPGFGFLSENAGFARSVQEAGLIWVGPHPEAIASMASKAQARDLAEAAGVPVLKGLQHLDMIDAQAKPQLQAFAKETSFPLLVKAAYGGGGKGMRRVERAEDLLEAAERCASEARAAFGNGELVVERYLESARHVEVQVLGDKHGQVCVIGDRDCSVQRRHQKIIEEAPAWGLTESVRSSMHATSKRLAEQVKYDSAGTVEFLVVGEGEGQEYVFLEMNTRLQVEHPVTEEVFGVDLVRKQLEVAAGEALSQEFCQAMQTQSKQPSRASVEVRIYAEDPWQGFRPAPGLVWDFQPSSGPGVRWEIGMDADDEVTPRFDPMVAKLVTTGDNRGEALDRLSWALRNTVLQTAASNMELLLSIVEDQDFRDKHVSTAYLCESRMAKLQAWADVRREALENDAEQLFSLLQDKVSLPGEVAAWQTEHYGPAGYARQRLQQVFSTAQEQRPVEAHWQRSQPYLRPSSQDKSYPLWWVEKGMLQLTESEVSKTFCYSYGRTCRQTVASLSHGGFSTHRVCEQEDEAWLGRSGSVNAESVLSPVPGKVVALLVEAGQQVSEGERLFVMESMKMEIEVRAEQAGTVDTVEARVGDQTESGTVLLRWRMDDQDG